VSTTHDLPQLPAIVDGHVSHRRKGPVTHAFRHRAYQWLVDLDRMPRTPWYLRPVARFEARDHLGGTTPDGAGDIKTNVLRFLADRGVRLGAGSRVVMLANARVLGHVFDPLTVFWCFDSVGTLRCVVAEVHNTYGERHAYLLEPAPGGQARVDKQFYVSPFNDVSGEYSLRFELSGQRVAVSVALVRERRTVFNALFAGTPRPATSANVARTALRMPAMPQKVSLLIRVHGLRLWLKRLPIVDRPISTSQRGV
jgi:uncharacterized protein